MLSSPTVRPTLNVNISKIYINTSLRTHSERDNVIDKDICNRETRVPDSPVDSSLVCSQINPDRQ